MLPCLLLGSNDSGTPSSKDTGGEGLPERSHGSCRGAARREMLINNHQNTGERMSLSEEVAVCTRKAS